MSYNISLSASSFANSSFCSLFCLSKWWTSCGKNILLWLNPKVSIDDSTEFNSTILDHHWFCILEILWFQLLPKPTIRFAAAVNMNQGKTRYFLLRGEDTAIELFAVTPDYTYAHTLSESLEPTTPLCIEDHWHKYVYILFRYEHVIKRSIKIRPRSNGIKNKAHGLRNIICDHSFLMRNKG